MVIISVSDTEEWVMKKLLQVVGEFSVEEKVIHPQEKIVVEDIRILIQEKRVYRKQKELFLSNHEFNTLVYLARHPGWIRTKEQIYEAVWSEEVEEYGNAVMWCISQLRKKIEPDPKKPQYIHTIKGIGYKFEFTQKGNTF